ncbi:MAG TPA: hypothetical protein VGP26_17560 [Actinophytocola sp.]|nr:hypothetical protein [Actinophytocola sp.]
MERQLERLEARLIAEFCDGPVSERTVHEHLAAARENYVGARVWIYLPILIEREVRHRLRSQMPTADGRRIREASIHNGHNRDRSDHLASPTPLRV